MNIRRNLIAAIIAVLLTGLELVAWNGLADKGAHGVRGIAAPDVAIPVLPQIDVRPTPEQVHAASIGGHDVATVAHPDYAMPFYSFAAKRAAADKG